MTHAVQDVNDVIVNDVNDVQDVNDVIVNHASSEWRMLTR